MGSSRPLQIDLILEQIFMNLDLETLKSCRQVCSKWEKTSRKLFMRKSVIYISNKEPIENDLYKFVNDFVEDSRDSIEWRFTKFNFVGEFLKDDLDAFIDSRVNILEGIKFENVSTMNAEEDPENWKWKWNATHLNHFALIDDWIQFPKMVMTIALSNLRTTKTIILQGALDNLNIILDEKISPTSLTVHSFAKFWTKDGLRLENGFSLNEFFEVKNLIHLDFQGPQNVNVDLSESLKLETCTFQAARITGWNRHLKALTMLNLRCEHFDPMAVPTSVKDLSVWFNQPDGTMDLTDFLKLEILSIVRGGAVGWHQNLILNKLTLYNFRSHLDLSLLPKSLEILAILDSSHDSVIICSSPSTTSFPNVKTMQTFGGDVALYGFCPSLTELSLITAGKLFADLLPETVKRININAPVEIIGRPPNGAVDIVNVNDLFEWQLIDDILEHLNPRKIIVKPIFLKTTKMMILEKVLDRIHASIQKQMKRSDGIFVIRKLRWRSSHALSVGESGKIFTDSGLPLGLMFESYIFENGVGAPELQWRI